MSSGQEEKASTSNTLEDSPPSHDSFKYDCVICKRPCSYRFDCPNYHDAATGAFICRLCSIEMTEREELRRLAEVRIAAGEVGELVDIKKKRSWEEEKERASMKKEWIQAEEKDLWTSFLSNEISFRPLASRGIKPHAFYHLQMPRDPPLENEPGDECRTCSYRCSCPNRGSDYTPYPPCYICEREVFTVLEYSRHCNVEENCGQLYCVYCRRYVCDEHTDTYEHRHPRRWIVTYEDSFEFTEGRVPIYDVCWWHRSTPYSNIDMSIMRQVCTDCCDASPDNDYIYYKKAGIVIRERIAIALTTALNKKADGSDTAQPLTAPIVGASASSSSSSSQEGGKRPTARTGRRKPDQGTSVEQPQLYSLPELISLFKEVEAPLFDLLVDLSDTDCTVREMLPVTKDEAEEWVESKTLNGKVLIKTWKYKTPLDEHIDRCRRLWGEVSNELLLRVEVYAKSRFGMARSLEHCLESLNVSSLFLPSESTESKQGETGTKVSDRTRGRQAQAASTREEANSKPKKEGSKQPESALKERKVVTKDDVLNVLNQVPITKERMSEELTYLRTLESLRETIEYGDPLFITLTKEKVESIATRLKPALIKLKEHVLVLRKKKDKKHKVVLDLVETLNTNHASLFKEAGKMEYWLKD